MKVGIYLNYNNIGYAVINGNSIIEAGVDNVKITSEERIEYIKGRTISTNPNRTLKRSARVNLQRYKQRRKLLYDYLNKLNILPSEPIKDSELWQLRAKAVSEKLELTEYATVLIHLAKKRGYKASGDKFNENSDYLLDLEKNTEDLHNSGLFIGQYHYERFKQGLRIKEILFKREDYEAEFWAITNKQKEFHSELTSEVINKLYDIIYYQRPLKSQKHRVSRCKYNGRRVAHKTNPYFQEYKILTEIDNLKLFDAYGRDIPIEENKLDELYAALMISNKLTVTQILKVLGYNARKDKVTINYDTGLSGNVTYSAIKKIVTEFNPNFDELYNLWHLLYSVVDDSKKKVLIDKYKFTEEQTDDLIKLNFGKEGYCNLSEKAIKAILPHLRNKKNLHDSVKLAGLKEIKNNIVKSKFIPLFKKNFFGNIVVEKAGNRFVNLINRLTAEYPVTECIFEIDSMILKGNEGRKKAVRNKNFQIKEDALIKQELFDKYGLTDLTRKDLIKYQLWNEFNGISPYEPTKEISVLELLDRESNDPYEVEHIIPSSRLFDHTLSNKTICRRSINIEKDNKTTAEFMKSKGDEVFNQFKELIENSSVRTLKKKRLLAENEDIDNDYILSKIDVKHYYADAFASAIQSAGITTRYTHRIISNHLKDIWKIRDEDVSPCPEDDIRLNAINAIVVAFTDEGIIKQLNDLNKNYLEAHKEKLSLRNFEVPFANFTEKCKELLNSIIPRYKVGERIYTVDKNGNANPRQRLHQETVMGLIKRFQKDKKGKWYEYYEAVVKYPINTITGKDVQYIVDGKIRQLIEKRLADYGGNIEKAWSTPLSDHNNKVIRTVRLYTKAQKIRPLHFENGKWKDYVIEGNLHHVSFYKDKDDKLKLTEVSAMTVIMRKNIGMEIIIKEPAKANELLNNYTGKVNIDEVFKSQMPSADWEYIYTIQKGMLITYNNTVYRIHSFSGNKISLMLPHYAIIGDVSKHVNVGYGKLSEYVMNNKRYAA